MSKLISALVLSMVILATQGFALGQDEPRTTDPPAQEDTLPNERTLPAPLEPGDLVISEKEQAYLAALTECESLEAGQKQMCIETVKKEYGRE